jgi:hypothetical protein
MLDAECSVSTALDDAPASDDYATWRTVATDLQVADQGEESAGIPNGRLQGFCMRQLPHQLCRKVRAQLQHTGTIAVSIRQQCLGRTVKMRPVGELQAIDDCQQAHHVWRAIVHELDQQRHAARFVHRQPPRIVRCHCRQRLQFRSMLALQQTIPVTVSSS